MKHRFASRFIVFSVLLALIFSAVGTAPAKAWGPFSHTEIVRLALEMLSDSDMKTLLHDYQGSVMAGSVFPDWGMAYGMLPGKDKAKFDNLAEFAHWSEFVTAYLDYVRQNYSPPYDVQESKSIAFMFGIIAHNVGDPFFHDYLLPHAQIIDNNIFGMPGHTDVELGVDVFNIFREIWCVAIPTGCASEYLDVDWYLPTGPIMAAYAELYANEVTWYELNDINDLTAGWAAYQTASTAQIAGESILTVFEWYSLARLPQTYLIFEDYEPGGDFDAAGHVADMWARTWEIFEYTGVYHVKPAPSGKADCKSWDNACTLQTALFTPYGSNQVWIMGGTYKPSETANRTATFKLRYGLDVYGGFAGTEDDPALRDPVINLTTLSGDIDASGENDSYHVVMGATGSTLDGFTITKGNANGSSPDDVGGGMLNKMGENTIRPIVSNVIFIDNSASQKGGGVYNYHSISTFTNVTFSNNNSLLDGGGMYNNTSSSPALTNVTFSGNSASQNGGGMYNSGDSDPTLSNVTFSGNSASQNGGGMYNSDSSPQIRNTILWGNIAPIGSQIENAGTSAPVVSDSVIQFGYPGGTNILTGDPLFGVLGNYGGWTPTIPIQEASSAIDTGNDGICQAPGGAPDYGAGGLDQRFVPRPQSLACDIGAFEADITDPVVTVPPDKIVEATGPNGAVVDFIGEVSATDELSPANPAVTCDPVSGSTFPLGVTTVTCEATDDAGNTGSSSFTITVEDTTAPTLSLPAGIIVFQDIAAGAIVNFKATATDLVDPLHPVVLCIPAAGSTFPRGITTVNCSATDTAGNVATGSFTVTVRGVRNLLLKPDFSRTPTYPYPWYGIGLPPPYRSALDHFVFQSAPSSLRLTADKHNIHYHIFQIVKLSGLAGDKFTFGLSNLARYIPATDGLYQVELVFYNTPGKLLGTSVLKLIPGTHVFRLAKGTATAPADYSQITFRIVFQKTSGQAWFDDAFLMKVP